MAGPGCEHMPCNRPISGYRSRYVNENGKREISFRLQEGFIDMPIKVPCGECKGCRIDKSRDWALRIMHESQMHEENCFITLTYSPEHLPYGGSLVKKDFQDFMKRLRKKIKKEVRYFHCGEYGDSNNRPHYHAILFGYDFNDRTLSGISEADYDIAHFKSKALSKIWKKGFCGVGDVTFRSCAYVARYVTKKITKKDGAFEHYNDIDYETGEIINERIPEYCTMSRMPGIGKTWYEKYKKDLYPKDFVTHDGMKFKIPQYYDKLLEAEDPRLMKLIKERRMKHAEENDISNDCVVLESREIVKEAQIKILKRNMEVGN